MYWNNCFVTSQSKNTQKWSKIVDEQDEMELARRILLMPVEGINVGDYVRLDDGSYRRVAETILDDQGNGTVMLTTTKEGGSFHLLQSGQVRHSGDVDAKLYKAEQLDYASNEKLQIGKVWMYHHDIWKEGNTVEGQTVFPVFEIVNPDK